MYFKKTDSLTKEMLREGVVFLVDKPTSWTSFDVVNKIRFNCKKVLAQKNFKVGHAGTLDPLATGLLIICVGKFTKRIEEFMNLEKVYTGTFHVGATTPSFDSELPEDKQFPTDHIRTEDIKNACKQLTGEIMQIPPLFSAKRVDGEKAYEIARRGEEMELKASKVCVHEFVITKEYLPDVDFKIRCSKGTYIRSLARDFGTLLGSGAYLTLLRREKIGVYDVQEAFEVKELCNIINSIT